MISLTLPVCSIAIDLLGPLISSGVNSWNLYLLGESTISSIVLNALP